MKKQSETMATVSWRGKNLTVKNEKLRLCFVEAKQLLDQLQKQGGFFFCFVVVLTILFEMIKKISN